MKTKFIINDSVFLQNHETIEESFAWFRNHFEEEGFILNEEDEEVYKIYDKEYNFNKKDKIGLSCGYYIVSWKCTEIDEDMIVYILEEE